MDPSNDAIKMLSHGLKPQEKNGISIIASEICLFPR
jgi:hypothetical protein